MSDFVTLQCIKNNKAASGDREALRAFLAERELTLGEPEDFPNVYHHGKRFTFDEYGFDIHISDPDDPGLVTANILGPSLIDEQCQFIYDICAAVGWLVITPVTGPPYIIDINDNHDATELEFLAEQVGTPVGRAYSWQQLRHYFLEGYPEQPH